MGVVIEKIAGGISVDGLEFRNGKCGCTTVLPCCYSWSKVKRSGDKVQFTVKASGPDSPGMFSWGYTVAKDGTTVEVSIEDDRDKKIFSGYYPPALEEFVSKGWEVVAKTGEREDFGIWRCAACRWLYKEKDQKTPFADLPADWKCPVCKVGKDSFEKVA
ncbi:MAG: rubredoxin [Nitrospirota bacterium]|nr:rubredoxin [Nitrospirota bacterium]